MKSIGEGRLHYQATAADTNYYNIAQNLAEINARNEEVTDRKGNLYGYWCKVSTLSTANDYLILASIPNTWKVRNAFRRFHFAREEMFRASGVTKKEMGKYGRTIRPYFSPEMIDDGAQPCRLWDVKNLTAVDVNGGEWTYSMFASAPTVTDATNMGDVDIPPADEWPVTVLGGNVVQATSSDGTKTWDSVGMVQAYNSDRMEQIPDATADSSILSPNNALAALTSQSILSGEVTEIAEDQELEAPPYDIADVGDSTLAIWDTMPVAGTAGATAQHRSWGLYFFPAGLISLSSGAANSNALEIEVLGKELCKDVA